MKLFLESLERRPGARIGRSFPWTVPALASLERMRFRVPVTFFVGENGSGKSTLLEAIAIAVRAVTAGAHEAADDPTLAGARRLAGTFTVRQPERPLARLFFRAEDAFGFTRRVEREMGEIEREREQILADESAGLTARTRAAGHLAAQRSALVRRYGEDPHAFSHGETFLGLLRERIVPRGLYLLDEPDTPLSPTRVLALLAMVYEGVREGSQFVIATHSPMLAALPGAEILLFDAGAIRPAAHAELDHVRVTRDFLAAPEAYLRRLLAEE